MWNICIQQCGISAFSSVEYLHSAVWNVCTQQCGISAFSSVEYLHSAVWNVCTEQCGLLCTHYHKQSETDLKERLDVVDSTVVVVDVSLVTVHVAGVRCEPTHACLLVLHVLQVIIINHVKFIISASCFEAQSSQIIV